jgi:hypothetical protein
MNQKAKHVLEDCLVLLEQDQITLEECLRRYPDHADELRVLIPIALEARRVSLPSPSPAAIEMWERRMSTALDKKEQQPASRRILGKVLPLRQLAYVAALLLVALLVGTYLYFGSETTTVQAATLTGVSGSVQVLTAGNATWRSASAGQEVNAGDRVRVGSISTATLSFPSGCSTDLQANTDVDLVQVSVQRDGRGGTVVLYQRLGQTHSCVQHSPGYDSRFEIRTPSANVIARETRFTVIVENNGVTDVAVAEGTVEVMSQALSIFVQAGEGTSVKPEQPPIPVYTIPALTSEPEEHETPEPGEPQESQEPEEHESPEPPGVEETEEPERHETPEPSEPEETKEPEESDKTEEPEESEESKEPEESAEPDTEGDEETEEHETRAPDEPQKTEEADELK